jgi:hypothetical protein
VTPERLPQQIGSGGRVDEGGIVVYVAPPFPKGDDPDICDEEFDGDATNPQEGCPHRRHLSSPPHLANDGIGGDVYLWCGKGWVGLCLPFPRVQPPEDEDG